MMNSWLCAPQRFINNMMGGTGPDDIDVPVSEHNELISASEVSLGELQLQSYV